MTSFATFPIGAATFCHHGRASVARPHVTKCHVCHAKRSYVTLGTLKNDVFCNFSHRHDNFLPPRSRIHMSQCATPAMRNVATSDLKHPKITPFATFPIGKETFCHDGRSQSVAAGCGRLQMLQTVASGCKRLRTPKRHPANTPPPPDPQSVQREPFATQLGKNRLYGSRCPL